MFLSDLFSLICASFNAGFVGLMVPVPTCESTYLRDLEQQWLNTYIHVEDLCRARPSACTVFSMTMGVGPVDRLLPDCWSSSGGWISRAVVSAGTSRGRSILRNDRHVE